MTEEQQKTLYATRACGKCGYEVINRFIKKCPRCLSALPSQPGVSACGTCAQGCPTAVTSSEDKSR